MDHVICINTNSLPASDAYIGNELFADAIQGVLALNSGSDNFTFYLDCNSGTLNELEISNGYTYQDFIDAEVDQDIKLFLYEIEDKSPALDSLTEEQIEELTEFSYYIPNQPLDENTDVFGLAWMLSGYLLSINTQDKWNQSTIDICRYDENGQFVNEPLMLRNISSQDHGNTHYQTLNQLDIRGLIGKHKITDKLLAWFDELSKENQLRVADKLTLSCRRNFQGGKPLFETLEDEDGIREIRISAYTGGAIRILFKHLKEEQQAILCGFIKKSNNEGYKAALKIAHDEFSKLS